MLRNLLRLTLAVFVIGLAVTLRPAEPASAIVHLAEIHEVMAGFDGDADVQYVEVNMRLGGQNITINSTLAVFDASGTFIDGDAGTVGDQPLVTFPGNVPNAGDGVRWIVGTTEFETASGITADFVMPSSPGLTPNAGMVCIFEFLRDFTDPSQSIDCVAYGGASFTGENPNSNPSEAATTGPGDGEKSLTRIVPADLSISPPWARSDDANDFDLRCPTPENNAGEIALLGADDDGDGLPNCHEVELGKNPADADSDGDGCSDGAEEGTDATTGGQRDSLNPWDFYDVAGSPLPPQNGAPDGVVDLPNDILGVIQHHPAGTLGYDVQFDRGTWTGPNSWNDTQGPDGVIDLPNDILGVILQFQHNCQ